MIGTGQHGARGGCGNCFGPSAESIEKVSGGKGHIDGGTEEGGGELGVCKGANICLRF